MTWTIIQNRNLIFIKTEIRNDPNFSLQRKLYYTVLAEQLLKHQISLLTLQPRSYSFGHELKGSENKRFEGKPFLVNNNIDCNSQALLDIIHSEEFRRSLLFIIKYNSIDFEKIAITILNSLNTEQSINFDVENSIYYTQNDGNTLCLYNSNLTKDKLDSLLTSSTRDFKHK